LRLRLSKMLHAIAIKTIRVGRCVGQYSRGRYIILTFVMENTSSTTFSIRHGELHVHSKKATFSNDCHTFLNFAYKNWVIFNHFQSSREAVY
jgi:hypothetical protein